MGCRIVLGGMLLIACNAQLHQSGRTVDATPGNGSDGATDAPSSMTDADQPLGMWSAPQAVPGASTTTASEDDCTLSSTGTELYFAVPDAGITGNPKQLWIMTRATRNDPWGQPTKLDATFNTAVQQESPRLSPDDLTIYFGRAGDIYTATRGTVGGTWSMPQPVDGLVNTANYEKWLAVCAGGRFVVSRANGATGQDLYEGVLGVDGGTLADPLNSAASEISTWLSADCRTIYFASNRNNNQTQLFKSQRAAVGAPWDPPAQDDSFGTATDNEDPWLSPDQRLFVFSTVRGGATTKDLYFSTR